ncbi:SIMPL domain-containing protein [Parafilimonas sp.]|uniref:SIMPL domain-containing protein n=1 Tax=Parafilimonas sp. TaxID=1969739 RepID=UPI0039E3CD95
MKKAFLTLLASLFLLFAHAQTGDNTIKQRTINVTGTAELEITPDEIYVQVELREYTRKNGEKVDIETIRNQFLNAAKSMGIADTDVVVQGYSGWDGNYWWYKKNKQKNPDMNAGVTYEVKVKSVNDMDKLVDKLDDQATQNFSLSHTSHSNLDSIKKALKVQAIQAAKEKAIYLAAALGDTVGQALTINDPTENGTYPRPVYSANMMMKAADTEAAPMDVDFKKMKIQYNVNVVFELK